MVRHLSRCVIAAAALALATSVQAQQPGSSTSTTTTKTKTTTTTTGSSWKTPDGTKGGSSSTTTTNTRSQSTTIGTASPTTPARPAPGLPVPSSGVQWMAGSWNASEGGKPGACRVQIYKSSLESGGGATSSGCTSDLNGIGNWALRGDTLMLIKNMLTTAATLQRTGPSRFDGRTASGTAISIWR